MCRNPVSGDQEIRLDLEGLDQTRHAAPLRQAQSRPARKGDKPKPRCCLSRSQGAHSQLLAHADDFIKKALWLLKQTSATFLEVRICKREWALAAQKSDWRHTSATPQSSFNALCKVSISSLEVVQSRSSARAAWETVG